MSYALRTINTLFDSEASLDENLKPFIAKIEKEIMTTRYKLHSLVREQALEGESSQKSLDDAKVSITELTTKIEEIQQQAAQSERMILELCHDIQRLDLAKKNFNSAVTTLKRLQMLTTSITQLEQVVHASETRNYDEAAPLVRAATELLGHFNSQREHIVTRAGIDKIADLNARMARVTDTLSQAVMRDFQAVGAASSDVQKEQLLARLQTGCQLIEAMGPDSKKNFFSWFLKVQLSSYKNLNDGTNGTAEERFRKLEERFTWLTKRLGEVSIEYGGAFPQEWQMLAVIVDEWVNVTCTQLSDILDELEGAGFIRSNVPLLLQKVQKVADFETQLDEVYSTNFESEEKKERWIANGYPAFSFKGRLVIWFERFLDEYRNKERANVQRLVDDAKNRESHGNGPESIGSKIEIINKELGREDPSLRPTMADDISTRASTVSDSPRACSLDSAADMMVRMRLSLENCARVSQKQTLYGLYRDFLRIILAYCEYVSAMLPTLRIVHGPVPYHVITHYDGLTTLPQAVLVLLTADYIAQTLPGLKNKVRGQVDPEYRVGVDSCVEYTQVASKCEALLDHTFHVLLMCIFKRSDVGNWVNSLSTRAWVEVDDKHPTVLRVLSSAMEAQLRVLVKMVGEDSGYAMARVFVAKSAAVVSALLIDKLEVSSLEVRGVLALRKLLIKLYQSFVGDGEGDVPEEAIAALTILEEACNRLHETAGPSTRVPLKNFVSE
ncbi:Vps53-like, N-terminal [Carpediemonas membranifera]|uniref:Vps53-like, N-terminal n=1 Tax=Carpediemonas membranifera TaxID=201153 RepID=A0A8J6BAX9_9EUKA|nr:Vps53-like, N-terminal [Carpediemonas membranifera]|eukprot:KAG9396929.1 Vps53-like, N-terminal [Carpediemonas membranifera]